jgi:hypothetical protein
MSKNNTENEIKPMAFRLPVSLTKKAFSLGKKLEFTNKTDTVILSLKEFVAKRESLK